MLSKADIFNLALGALLLERRVVNANTDDSREAKILRTHWDAAFSITLSDMDLDGTSSQVVLNKIADDPLPYWKFAYKYPDNCALFRRIRSCQLMDNADTAIPKRVGLHGAIKAIFTNEAQAVAEYIPTGLSENVLSPQAALAVAYRLAIMAAPLATGKGAKELIEKIEKDYLVAKAEAQEQDKIENMNFVDPRLESEFVGARMG